MSDIIDRLNRLPKLSEGQHESIEDGMCINEAVSYIAGEPWSDHPQCVCPVIAEFLRTWNDALSDLVHRMIACGGELA